jgi:hypothetical protein
MIGTRGKRMVEMIIMLMKRTSPARSEGKKNQANRGAPVRVACFFASLLG